jgi:hypothetical protein
MRKELINRLKALESKSPRFPDTEICICVPHIGAEPPTRILQHCMVWKAGVQSFEDRYRPATSEDIEKWQRYRAVFPDNHFEERVWDWNAI